MCFICTPSRAPRCQANQKLCDDQWESSGAIEICRLQLVFSKSVCELHNENEKGEWQHGLPAIRCIAVSIRSGVRTELWDRTNWFVSFVKRTRNFATWLAEGPAGKLSRTVKFMDLKAFQIEGIEQRMSGLRELIPVLLPRKPCLLNFCKFSSTGTDVCLWSAAVRKWCWSSPKLLLWNRSKGWNYEQHCTVESFCSVTLWCCGWSGGEALTEMQKSFADRLAEEKKATVTLWSPGCFKVCFLQYPGKH